MVINQGRYIISAVLILLLLLSGLFIFKKTLTTNSKEQDVTIVENPINGRGFSESYSVGKSLFFKNCASCHTIMKDMTGPALAGLEERGSWKDRKKLYEWVHNPPGFMLHDDYTKSLKEKYGVTMSAFPDLSEKNIDAIVDYINNSYQQEILPVAMN